MSITFAANAKLTRKGRGQSAWSRPGLQRLRRGKVMGSNVNAARVMYDELGFDTLPLIPGDKKAYPRAWQRRPVNRLWQNAPEGANIGIRGGGLADVAVIDCDEPRTFETVTNWLAGLGYRGDSYPVVQTASGEGRHVYITLAGVLSGDWRVLSKEIGAGEFRFGAGSYVAAPPSAIKDGGGYFLISGDFSIRPALEVKDVLQILGNRETVIESKPTLPRRAVAMLHGKGVESFSTRSHFDESLIASLINAGHTFESVLDLFESKPTSGKYHELKTEKGGKAALHYLRKSFTEAQKWTQAHESKARQIAQSAITWAESKAWQGRTGAVDRLIFIAHAETAYRAGRLTYAAACRDLAERAGIGFKTATRATWRLCDSGLIIPDKKAVGDSANVYQLGGLDKLTHFLTFGELGKCVTMSAHDVFRFSGLGKSAGEVYAALQERPATVEELAEITGRHERTVKRVLERMAKLADPLTGEILPMVASDDGETFRPLPVDLDRVAHAIGTAGMGERQRKEHAKDRRLHARNLERGRQTEQS